MSDTENFFVAPGGHIHKHTFKYCMNTHMQCAQTHADATYNVMMNKKHTVTTPMSSVFVPE